MSTINVYGQELINIKKINAKGVVLLGNKNSICLSNSEIGISELSNRHLLRKIIKKSYLFIEPSIVKKWLFTDNNKNNDICNKYINVVGNKAEKIINIKACRNHFNAIIFNEDIFEISFRDLDSNKVLLGYTFVFCELN